MNDVMQFLLTLTPAQAAEAVAQMSPEAKAALVSKALAAYHEHELKLQQALDLVSTGHKAS